jgi:hypothetical protein
LKTGVAFILANKLIKEKYGKYFFKKISGIQFLQGKKIRENK